ncbi:G-protein coupled receptor Mth2-like isoform X4 [Cylas formicarius]|uniref:G-protein coupled receptor Mth2-like isoform X4 n=1 Tax=Cylas formicarius TaxID=197179 RepID=UPI00295869C3|nr:G-protein coupled receptor Mth2-like isoform X4 [Cylas formicarius]
MHFSAIYSVACALVLVWCVENITSGEVKCDTYVDITDGVKSGPNITKDGLIYTENDYFVDNNVIKGCICRVSSCVRKCCAANESIASNTNSTCVDVSLTPNASSDLDNVFPDVALFHIISAPARDICVETSYKILLDYEESSLVINHSGYLQWDELFYPYTEYCLANLEHRLVALICVVQDVSMNALIYCIGMIISMPFLLATFLVYALLPDRNLHQKALMFYVLTLFVSYVLLVTINLSDSLVEPGCTLIGYLTLFFFMVSFFWMNVICLDIWFTFSGSRGFVGSKRSSERKRLLIYCGYAWGVPLLLTFTVLLIQTYSDPESQFNPAIGSTKCFLGDGLPNLLYFYGETAILIIINVTLFGLTAYKIRKVKKETSMLKQNDSKRHSYEKDKQKFNLFLKLLFAMGVNWSMEIISWAVNWSTGNTYTAVWYLTDFCNAAYGVFIFFIFVFKKKIWNLLQKRYLSQKTSETVVTGTSQLPSSGNAS